MVCAWAHEALDHAPESGDILTLLRSGFARGQNLPLRERLWLEEINGGLENLADSLKIGNVNIALAQPSLCTGDTSGAS